MTPMQLGLLYESALSDSPSLNILQIVARWPEADFDAAALFLAWQRVAARHDSLRLVLNPLADGDPTQDLIAEPRIDIEALDWTGDDRDAAGRRLAEWLETDRRQGIALSETPMWRVRAFRLPEGCVAMVWTFHHALLDGGGFRTVLGDLFKAYSEARKPRPVAVVPDPAPSFLRHCRDVAALDHGSARAFFAGHLAGFDTPNRLGEVFAAASPKTGGDRRATVAARLDPALAASLRERAKGLGVATSALVAAAWAIVLGRCSGRDEAVFGVTRSGRYLSPEARNCAGCFINTLPCRVSLGGRTLRGLARDTGAWLRDIRPFEHVPHADILAATGFGRGGSGAGAALYGSVVLFERGSLERLAGELAPDLPGLTLEERGHIAVTLSLSVYDDPDMLVQVDHDPARISDAGAARLHGYVMALLRTMATAPEDLPLDEVGMLPEDEQAQLAFLACPDDPPAADEAARPVLDRIAEAVRRDPARIAVRQFGTDVGIGYGDLDRRADRIAAAVAAAGVQPGDVVALALPRSADYVAALLGVWKAGAAILPLDPSYPPEALRDMLDRSGAVLVLAGGERAHPVDGHDLAVLRVDALDDGGDAPLSVVPDDPDRLAYVIFTSGSTGQPKGVAIPHRALSAHAAAIIRAFGLVHDDRVLQFTSLNFDVSIEEIVPTLCAGATLVLRDDAALTSVPGFLAALDDHAVTVANLPTAFWTVLSAEPLQIPSSLRLMIVGGERVSAAALSRWRTAHPGLRWLNGYGPTETAITATLYDAFGWHDGLGEVPIGRPIGPARVLVAAPDGSPAPFGVAGELWIGGAGLARGYLGRPDLTEASFVDTPRSPVAPRFYRTGDLVRWTDTGVLAFHGRIDRQIKIRGYRIELSALEARLERDPAIARAAATLDRAGSSAARILIWVQPAAGATAPEAASLQTLVGSVLPPAVRPAIMVVDDMPVTPAGKIDLGRLPRPDAESGDTDSEDTWEPAGEDVARMQGVFAAILGLDRVGPDQSFFDLGGHSLVSLRLMGQIEREFGRRLPVTLLQTAPTPRLLVAALAGDIAPTRHEGLVDVQPDGDLPPIYAVQVLGPDASLFRPLSWVLGKRQPFFGINLDVFDPLTPDTIVGIAEVMARSIHAHSAGRPVRLIGVSHGAQFAYELAGQLRAAGCEVATLIILDATGPDGRPQLPRTIGKVLRRIVDDPGELFRSRIGKLRDALGFRFEAVKDRFLSGVLAEGRARENLTAVSYGVRIDAMVNRFQPSDYGGHVIVVRAIDDFNDAPEAIESCLGWRRVVSGPIELVEIPGGHLSLLEAPHVERLAAALRERFAASQASGPVDTLAASVANVADMIADLAASGAEPEYSALARR